MLSVLMHQGNTELAGLLGCSLVAFSAQASTCEGQTHDAQRLCLYGFVLFCFVWLATLGVPVVAPGTAAGTFRRVVEAP